MSPVLGWSQVSLAMILFRSAVLESLTATVDLIIGLDVKHCGYVLEFFVVLFLLQGLM